MSDTNNVTEAAEEVVSAENAVEDTEEKAEDTKKAAEDKTSDPEETSKSDKAETGKEQPEDTKDTSETDNNDDQGESPEITKKEKSEEIADHEKKAVGSSKDTESKDTKKDEAGDSSEENKDGIVLTPVKKRGNGKKRLSKKTKKTIRIVVILVIIALLIVAGVLYVRNKMKAGMDAIREQMSSNLTPAQVERRDLTENISVTGKIRSNETRTQITSLMANGVNASQKILSVNVEVGDYVNEGDVLVTFSTEDIEKEISRTQEDLSRQKKIESIEAQTNQRTYVYSYQQAADTLEENAKTVDRALKNLYEACDGYGDAKRDLEEAKDKLEEARNANDASKIMEYESRIPSLEQAVATAKSREEQAQQTYDDAVSNEQSSGGRSMYSGIQSVQNNLADADATYQKSILNSDQSSRQTARNLQDYQDKLEDYVVVASMSGLVTNVKVAEGNSFSSGEVLTIQDVSKLKVDAEVDEYDIWKVKAGQRVLVKTEATGDEEFDAVVSLVHPTATAASGTSAAAGGSSTPTYTVTVDLLDKDDRLMLGMTAKMSIIVDQISDALCVPYDAIGQNADGEPVIYVLDDMSLIEKDKAREEAAKSGNFMDMFSQDNKNKGKDGEKSESLKDKFKGFFSKKDKPDRKANQKSNSSTEILVENEISGEEKLVRAGKDGDMGPLPEEEQYHEVVVETGMETDYYTEIITDKVKEDDYIVIKNNDGGNDFFNMMMGGMPPM